MENESAVISRNRELRTLFKTTVKWIRLQHKNQAKLTAQTSVDISNSRII